MSIEISMAGVHPMLAMPTNRDIPPETVRSLLDTQDAMQRAGAALSIAIPNAGSLVNHARTRTANIFLSSPCTHLFWVDSDIAWKANDFLRLVALATKFECVCAAYPRKQDGNQFYLQYLNRTIEVNELGLIPIKGTGLGFTIIQRKVIEELADKAPKLRQSESGEPMPRIFRADDIEDGEVRGEDYSFFHDVRALGYQVLLDPTVTLGHIGPKQYRASVMECIGLSEQT